MVDVDNQTGNKRGQPCSHSGPNDDDDADADADADDGQH